MQAVARILVGLTFIVSGILKMISIYDFELYLFSFGVFSLDFYSLLARIIIGVEMALGVGYIANKYSKFFYQSILYVLIAFTLFLIYLSVVGRDENCHCFGELISLDPLMSILKNVILLFFLLYAKGTEKYTIPVNKNIILRVCVLVATTPMVVNPPDKIWSLYYASSTINEEAFNTFVTSNDSLKLGSSVKILCFYSTTCHYCKLASQKVSQIVENNGLDATKVLNVFWGEESTINGFYEETKATVTNYKMMDVMEFLTITEGSMPIIVLLKEGGDITVFDYRSIDERMIIENLSNL